MPAFKDVFTVVPARKEGGKDSWVRIGVCFENRDGSFSVLLDALPTNGKLVIREHQEYSKDRPSRAKPQGDAFGGTDSFTPPATGGGDYDPFAGP